jgi:hypothetical protein
MKTIKMRTSLLAGAILASSAVLGAHITPPVVLLTERQAVTQLLAGASRYSVREVRLTAARRAALEARAGWAPEEEFFRFYIGRDEAGRLVGTAVFVSDFTVHGPVRVGVAVGPDGKVRHAAVMETTQETYKWVKPLVESGFADRYAGDDLEADFDPAPHLTVTAPGSMVRFYSEVIANLVRKGLAACEVAAETS